MDPLAFITPGPTEWVLILAIVLVLFGAKRLPELARGLGQGLNEFRKARDDFDRSLRGAELPGRQPNALPGVAPVVSAIRDGAAHPEVAPPAAGCNNPHESTTSVVNDRMHKGD
ncbi:MAG: twin-arginine translocase TatA/TatE family subunit [Verrucomicrobia bacterium]|nr:twin-arginine translocase TatA/TatE family subunit [Verrucomicrobiota bacterium]